MEISSSKDRDMNAAAQTNLRTYAAFRWPELNHKGRLRHLVRLLHTWTARRVRAVYNGEAGVSLRADERVDIAEITGEADAVRRSQENYRALEARLAALEALYSRFDPELVGEYVAGARAFARGEIGSPVSRGSGNGPKRGG